MRYVCCSEATCLRSERKLNFKILASQLPELQEERLSLIHTYTLKSYKFDMDVCSGCQRIHTTMK